MTTSAGAERVIPTFAEQPRGPCALCRSASYWFQYQSGWRCRMCVRRQGARISKENDERRRQRDDDARRRAHAGVRAILPPARLRYGRLVRSDARDGDAGRG